MTYFTSMIQKLLRSLSLCKLDHCTKNRYRKTSYPFKETTRLMLDEITRTLLNNSHSFLIYIISD